LHDFEQKTEASTSDAQLNQVDRGSDCSVS
jgi:hypothetical protein